MESGDHNTMLEKYSGLQKKTSSTSIKRKLQSDDPGLTLSWSGLSVYCVKKSNSFWSSGSDTKKLVNNVTGVAKAGTLTAVLGASGAGKTTLLSALAQRNNGGLIVEGDVRVNGKVIGPHIRNLSAFLYQKDLFFATLTVYEHLVFYARMKLDRRISKTEIKEKVHEILRQVGLLNVAHRQIGTSGDHFQIFLSGGEKRRLSFATELLSDPDLFFCDEVTSGLDSYSTLNLITTMKDMASHHQKTIICAIHQPSSEILDLFDSLVILAESRTAFIGNAKQGVEFMRTQGYPCPRNYNPADFFIKILAVIGDDEVNCRKRLKIICDAYVSSDAAQSIDARIDEEIDKHRFQPPLIEGPKRKQARPHIKPATWLTKLLLVTYRLQVDIFRNKKYLTFRLVQKAIVGIMMGWIYSGSLTRDQPGIQALEGFFLSLAIQNVASPLYASISKFQRQFPLFLRDYEDGLVSSLQFFTAMLLAWLPIILFESVLVTSSFYLLAGAFMTFHIFCTTLYIVSLAAMVSLLCGMSFAASIASFEICSYVLSELLSIVNILSGFYMNLRSVPVYLKLFELISWQRYTMEVLSILHLPPASSFSCTPSTIPGLELPCLHTGRQVLDKYGYEPARLVGDFFWMWGLIVSFYVIGYAFFWRRMVKLTTV